MDGEVENIKKHLSSLEIRIKQDQEGVDRWNAIEASLNKIGERLQLRSDCAKPTSEEVSHRRDSTSVAPQENHESKPVPSVDETSSVPVQSTKTNGLKRSLDLMQGEEEAEHKIKEDFVAPENRPESNGQKDMMNKTNHKKPKQEHDGHSTSDRDHENQGNDANMTNQEQYYEDISAEVDALLAESAEIRERKIQEDLRAKAATTAPPGSDDPGSTTKSIKKSKLKYINKRKRESSDSFDPQNQGQNRGQGQGQGQSQGQSQSGSQSDQVNGKKRRKSGGTDSRENFPAMNGGSTNNASNAPQDGRNGTDPRPLIEETREQRLKRQASARTRKTKARKQRRMARLKAEEQDGKARERTNGNENGNENENKQ